MHQQEKGGWIAVDKPGMSMSICVVPMSMYSSNQFVLSDKSCFFSCFCIQVFKNIYHDQGKLYHT